MKRMKRKVVAFVLAILMLPIIPTKIYASTSGHTQAEAVQWATDRANQHWEINDGSGWTQCTEFVWAYYEYLLGYHVRGNAYQYLTNTYGACPTGWTRPDKSTAQPGDIVIWDANSSFVSNWSDYSGQYGHIGVIISVNGNTMVTAEANAGESRGACGFKYNREVSCIDGLIRPDWPSNSSASFADWNNTKYTYIGETDAAIGQKVTTSGGTWTKVGMILYNNSNVKLGEASNTPTNGISQYYYKINEELGVTLTPGTTYKYKFYAVVGGTTFYSDVKSFTTGDRVLSSIRLKSIPNKVTYLENTDMLNTAGGKITLCYNNGTTEDINITTAMVSGFNNAKVGRQTLTVTYEGKTCTYDIFVESNGSSSDDEGDIPDDPTPPDDPKPSGGCYVATAVYGSYDCPEVWTLRRFRDETLAQTWYGRAFIHTYYAISPTLVKWFGDTDWFKNMWRGTLDKMVEDLNAKGVADTPYDDINW